MAEHIAYDTDKRIIYVTTAPVDGVVSISIKEHLYSDMKVDWQSDSDLGKFKLPLRSVGGDALPGSKYLGATFFLDNDWKIRPYESDHIFRMEGNMFSEDGTSVMIPTLGGYQVLAEMFVSNLTDSTVHQLEADDLLAYDGILHYDEDSIYTGQERPIGTSGYPVNNMIDGVVLIEKYHLESIHTGSDINLTANVEKLTIHATYPTLVFYSNGFKAHLCKFDNIFLDGNFNDSYISTEECTIISALNVYGEINDSYHNGNILISANQNLNMDGCQSGIAGLDSPTIDMNAGEDVTFSSRMYSGGQTIINCDTPACIATLSFPDGGKPHIEPSCTDGLLSIRGTGYLDDRSAGTTIETSAWIERGFIVDDVWDETMANHLNPGSTGEQLDSQQSITQQDKEDIADEVWDKTLPE